MECFPGWDEYFQPPSLPSMSLGVPLPDEQLTAPNPYDSSLNDC